MSATRTTWKSLTPLQLAKAMAPHEHIEAAGFMRVVVLHQGRYPALRWLHAIPNGGWRNPAVAGKLKAEGLRPGVLDYSWPYRTERYPGLYIELKRTYGGHVEDEQRDFAAFVIEQGYRAEFCKGWIDAWRVVCDYAGIPFKL